MANLQGVRTTVQVESESANGSEEMRSCQGSLDPTRYVRGRSVALRKSGYLKRRT